MESIKYTEGNWEPIFENYKEEPKRICMGVGINTKMLGGTYTVFVCNSMLPDTDEEYIDEREEIEGNMNLIAASPDMYKALKEFVNIYESEDNDPNKLFDAYWNARNALKKAENDSK